jgi:gluconokinase
MLADVFGRHVSLPNISADAAFGAALLGFVSAGALHSIADTGNLNVAQSFQPEPQAAARYGRLQLYGNLQQAFSEISTYQAEHTN